MTVACHNLLTLLKYKKIRGDLSVIWKESKRIRRITLLTIPNFAEADPSLAARLLSKFKQIDLICSQIYKGTIVPLLSLKLAHQGYMNRHTEIEAERRRRDG